MKYRLLALVLGLTPIVLLASAMAGVSASPDTLYVKVGGVDSGDCTSTPCASIGYALGQAFPSNIIKVAQGTYTENISIHNDVTLEGGYESTGWTRDIEAYETIVDGSGSQTLPGDWDGSYTYGPAVISDTGVYKMWYSGMDLYGTWRMGYAQSSNGIDWTKSASNPVLEPGSSGEWDEEGVSTMSVMKDGTTYKMWYTGWDEDGVWQIGYATSTNGLDWLKYAGNPVLEVGSPGAWNEDDVGDASVILDGATYKMWYYGIGGAGPNGQIGYATSPDGIDWTESVSNPVLQPGSSGQWDDEDVWTPAVVKENSTYEMWYAGSDGDTQRIGYATSSDGVVWNKYAGNPVLDVGAGGEWDESHAYVPMVIGTYEMWYTGQNSDGDWRIGYATSPDGTTWTKYANNPVLTAGTPGQWGEPVVYLSPSSDAGVVDGFAITGGDTSWGGGIVVDDSSPTIRNCTVSGNTAFNSGGGIVVWGGSPIIESNTITSNTANDAGGGIHTYGSTPTISDNHIEGNTARGGGGISIDHSSSGTVSGNEIISNTASEWAGGGIDVHKGSDHTISGNLIANNDAHENGGGIHLYDASATISDNDILSNTVSIWAGGGINVASGSSATIIGNAISGNSVNGSGGGIQLWSGANATISENTIAGNGAVWSGGGIVIHNDSQATMSRNTISGNTANYGGGISIGEGSTLTLTNDLVVRNVASVDCGTITFYESTGNLMNTTVADNSATIAPGGVCVELPTENVTITNSILVFNGGDDLYCPSGCAVSYSNLQEGVWPGAGNISVNPVFADAANGNYHLLPNSPVIDKGTNVGAPSIDFDGEPRPFDGDRDGTATVDVGADEVHVRWIYVPLVIKNF